MKNACGCVGKKWYLQNTLGIFKPVDCWEGKTLKKYTYSPLNSFLEPTKLRSALHILLAPSPVVLILDSFRVFTIFKQFFFLEELTASARGRVIHTFDVHILTCYS